MNKYFLYFDFFEQGCGSTHSVAIIYADSKEQAVLKFMSEKAGIKEEYTDYFKPAVHCWDYSDKKEKKEVDAQLKQWFSPNMRRIIKDDLNGRVTRVMDFYFTVSW